MFYVGMIFTGIGNLILIVGGIAAGLLFLYGIYLGFSQSISDGLIVVGASVVATIVLRILAALFIGIGAAIFARSVNKDIKPPDQGAA